MLVVENLKFAYEDNTVLNGIDLMAHSGELVGIVGPNGAGKTTLIRAISGVLKPELGIIKIKDIDLSRLIFQYLLFLFTAFMFFCRLGNRFI